MADANSPRQRPVNYWSRTSPASVDWDYVVVGSGMGGMTAAALLSKLGKRVLGEWEERAEAEERAVAERLERVVALEAELADAEVGSEATGALFDRSKQLLRSALTDPAPEWVPSKRVPHGCKGGDGPRTISGPIRRRRGRVQEPLRGFQDFSSGKQLASEHGDCPPEKVDPVADDVDAHASAAPRRLKALEPAPAEPLAPVRPEAAVRGAGDGILVDAAGGGEVTRDEVEIGGRDAGQTLPFRLTASQPLGVLSAP